MIDCEIDAKRLPILFTKLTGEIGQHSHIGCAMRSLGATDNERN